MRHTINTQLLQNLLNQAGKRPYEEVADLLKAVLDDAVPVEVPNVEPEVVVQNIPQEVVQEESAQENVVEVGESS